MEVDSGLLFPEISFLEKLLACFWICFFCAGAMVLRDGWLCAR